MGKATVHNGTVQRADPRLICSHHTINEVIQIAQFRKKKLSIHKIHMIHYSTPPENPNTSETTRTMLRSSQTTKRWHQQRKKDFLLQIPTKDIRLQILQDPTNSVLWRARQQQRAQVEPGSGNNHVLLATTRQKTTNSDILLSSKEGRSASKMDISSTAGQPGPGKDHRH
jgi:hypothetical protein